MESFAAANDINLEEFSAKLKARNLKSVCKTFHGAGLVVPVDRKTQVGYRELLETNGDFYYCEFILISL